MYVCKHDEWRQPINAVAVIIFYKLNSNPTTCFVFYNSSSGCNRLSNVHVFIYNSGAMKPITLAYFIYFDKRCLVIIALLKTRKKPTDDEPAWKELVQTGAACHTIYFLADYNVGSSCHASPYIWKVPNLFASHTSNNASIGTAVFVSYWFISNSIKVFRLIPRIDLFD